METKIPEFPAVLRAIRGSPRGRRLAFGAAVVALALLLATPLAAKVAAAPGAPGGPATVKGKTVGANKLLNPVWNEAKDRNLDRYTFREPSATVRPDVRTLTSFLPKELCVAALVPGDAKPRQPYSVKIGGGRTSPVTVVLTPGQQIEFVNRDPFTHRLYVVGPDPKGLPPADMAKAKTRVWTPPGPGTYEIRDQLAPSVRAWVVVDPHVANVGYPDRHGEFLIDLDPGDYTLRGYVNGQAVGAELPIKVTPVPSEQTLLKPLVVGESDAPPAPSGAPSAGKPAPKKAGGG
jgi:hypothetical protein